VLLVLRVIVTCFSCFWNLYIDWGLLRDKKTGLRPKITYAPAFYYFAAVVDVILRCTWVISFVLPTSDYPWIGSFEFASLMAFVELIRRWIWALIRIENE